MSTACRPVRAARLAALAGTVIALASPALAQTWNGASAVDSNWTTGANWVGGVAPVSSGSANLTFTGSTRANNTMNANWDVNSVTFNTVAAAFTINGPLNTLTLRAGGMSSASSNTQTFLNNTIVVSTSQTWASSVGSLVINPSQVTLNAALNINPTGTGSITLNSFINGTGVLNKIGSGTLLMGTGINPSTNSGLISIVQGTLRTTATNAITDAATVSISSGASLVLGGVSETLFGLSGGVSSSVDLQASTLTLNHDGADTLTFPGVISGTGNLTKLGTYTQTLSGPNTYSGTTTVSNGMLSLSADERLADGSILTVNGGVFDLQGFSETILAVNQAGGELGPFGGLNGTLSANAFNLESGVCRLRLTGNGGITKSNPVFNYLIFSGGNTYLGPTIVSGGILAVNGTGSLPNTTNVTVTSPGVLQVLNFPSTVSGLSGNGSVQINSTTFTVGFNDASSNFTGIIGDTGAIGNLTKIGNGTLTLSGANTFRGTTTLNAGTLFLNGAERLADSSSVVVNDGSFIVTSETVNRATLNGGELRSAIAGSSTLSAGQYLFNNGYCDAVLTGPGGLVKGTSGQVTMGIANNTHAFTRIDAGVLEASIAASLGTPSTNVLLNGGTLRLVRSMTLPMNVGTGVSSTIDCQGDITIPIYSNGFLSGGLSKIGPGRLTFNGTSGPAGPLGVNAGEVYLSNLVMPISGVSIASGGTLTIDNSVLSLTTSVSNLGRVQLKNNARVLGTSWGNNGIITGSGTIAVPVTNNSTGDVRIAENDSMLFSGTGPAIFSNAGLFEVLGGTAEFALPVTNFASTGLFYARDAVLRFNSGLTNFGGIALSFGTTDIFGDIDNRAGGVITISGASDATFVDDVINNGTLRTSTGSASVFLGALSGSGTFPGTGTVFMEGDLRPGNSPGRMTFGGDLVVGTFAGMQVEVAGTTAGLFDTIDVANTVVLDGTLDVAFVNNFRPTACDSLTIVHAGSVVGSFHTVHLPRNSALIYHPDRVELLLSACPADLDDGSATGTPDCGVTVDDLLYFIDGYTLGLLRADLDDGSNTGTPDGGVTIDDLLYYLDRFVAGC